MKYEFSKEAEQALLESPAMMSMKKMLEDQYGDQRITQEEALKTLKPYIKRIFTKITDAAFEEWLKPFIECDEKAAIERLRFMRSNHSLKNRVALRSGKIKP